MDRTKRKSKALLCNLPFLAARWPSQGCCPSLWFLKSISFVSLFQPTIRFLVQILEKSDIARNGNWTVGNCVLAVCYSVLLHHHSSATITGYHLYCKKSNALFDKFSYTLYAEQLACHARVSVCHLLKIALQALLIHSRRSVGSQHHYLFRINAVDMTHSWKRDEAHGGNVTVTPVIWILKHLC